MIRVGHVISLLGILTMGSSVLIYGRLDALLSEQFRLFAFLTIVVGSITGVVYALYKNHFAPALISLLVAGYVAFNVVVFGEAFRTGVAWTAMLQFSPLFAVSLFYLLVHYFGIDRVLLWLFRCAVAYAVIYLLLSIALYNGSLPAGAAEKLVLGDGAGFRQDAREDRIVGYLSLLAFGWFAALSSLRSKIGLKGLTTAALFGTCIVLANSRTFTICLAAITILYVIRPDPRTIYKLSYLALIAIVAYFLLSLYSQSNPFLAFQYDNSGAARARSYETAWAWIQRLPVFGVGVPPSPEAESTLVTGRFFSLTDLGAVGILYGHGFVGLIVWLAGPLLLTPGRMVDSPKRYLQVALILTMSEMIIYQAIAPTWWYGGGTMMVALFAGYMIAVRHRAPQAAHEGAGSVTVANRQVTRASP